MRRAVIMEWAEVWDALKAAMLTTMAAIFGKRTHDGFVVRFRDHLWFPNNWKDPDQ